MKEFIYKIWNWLVGLLNKIRRDRLYHFICGLLIGAFCCLVLKMGFWCFVPVLFIGFIKEFIDQWQDGNFDWIDLLATFLGGAIIALMALA